MIGVYAHVTTYRLGTEVDVLCDMEYVAGTDDDVISDETARTIASWWHSPAENSRNITALSHGRPFDTEELADEIIREITDPDHVEALLAWVYALEEFLQQG